MFSFNHKVKNFIREEYSGLLMKNSDSDKDFIRQEIMKAINDMQKWGVITFKGTLEHGVITITPKGKLDSGLMPALLSLQKAIDGLSELPDSDSPADSSSPLAPGTEHPSTYIRPSWKDTTASDDPESN